MDLPFAKLEAAGNGYIAVDGRDLDVDWSALARAMTAPNTGIGSDGLAVVQRSERAPVRMRIFNSDGSEAEMSGNGIRLFAKFVIDRSIATAGDDGLQVETGGGVRTVWPTLESGKMRSARVAMGMPSFEPADIPVDLGALDGAEQARDFPLEVGGQEIAITCLAIGNPHAVALLDEPVDDFPLDEIGPLVVEHAMFPNRINFEIVNVEGPERLRIRVLERGEGETLSSGTGSTASAIAARVHGRTEKEVEVAQRGGTLGVRWEGPGHEAFLEGPTLEVFEGVWRVGGSGEG